MTTLTTTLAAIQGYGPHGPMHGPVGGYAQGPMGGGYMGGGLLGGWGWLLALLVLLGLAVAAVAYLAREADGDARRTDPALDELRAAYARGDLTDEEYDRRRGRLAGDHGGGTA